MCAFHTIILTDRNSVDILHTPSVHYIPPPTPLPLPSPSNSNQNTREINGSLGERWLSVLYCIASDIQSYYLYA